MDLRKLKTLIDLVSESNISELEITEADGKVRIVKADPAVVAPVSYVMPPAQPMAAQQISPLAAAPPSRARKRATASSLQLVKWGRRC